MSDVIVAVDPNNSNNNETDNISPKPIRFASFVIVFTLAIVTNFVFDRKTTQRERSNTEKATAASVIYDSVEDGLEEKKSRKGRLQKSHSFGRDR